MNARKFDDTPMEIFTKGNLLKENTLDTFQKSETPFLFTARQPNQTGNERTTNRQKIEKPESITSFPWKHNEILHVH